AKDVESGDHVPQREEKVVQHLTASSARVAGLQHGDDLVQTDAARRFDQHEVAGLDERGQKIGGRGGVWKVIEALLGESRMARAVKERLAPLGHSDHDIDLQRDPAAGLVVVFQLARSELQHVAEYGNAAAANLGPFQQSEGARHGVWVR